MWSVPMPITTVRAGDKMLRFPGWPGIKGQLIYGFFRRQRIRGIQPKATRSVAVIITRGLDFSLLNADRAGVADFESYHVIMGGVTDTDESCTCM